jgi:hypothetical protein
MGSCLNVPAREPRWPATLNDIRNEQINKQLNQLGRLAAGDASTSAWRSQYVPNPSKHVHPWLRAQTMVA